MWRHNDVIGRNEYLISTWSESTVPEVYSLQFLFKSTHHSWRYGRKYEWVFFLNTVYITFDHHCGGILHLRYSHGINVFFNMASVHHIRFFSTRSPLSALFTNILESLIITLPRVEFRSTKIQKLITYSWKQYLPGGCFVRNPTRSLELSCGSQTELNPNSTRQICCGFVVQQAVQQIHNKSV